MKLERQVNCIIFQIKSYLLEIFLFNQTRVLVRGLLKVFVLLVRPDGVVKFLFAHFILSSLRLTRRKCDVSISGRTQGLWRLPEPSVVLTGASWAEGLHPQYKQPLCRHTQTLCGLIDLKTLLEHTFQSPMFIRGSPSTTQTITVWVGIYNHCVG